MDKQQTNGYQYQSFLIRLWRDDERVNWRASAQHTLTSERVMFANLGSLFVYLDTCIKQQIMTEDSSD